MVDVGLLLGGGDIAPGRMWGVEEEREPGEALLEEAVVVGPGVNWEVFPNRRGPNCRPSVER